ncbi:MAG: hypothetical protein JST14_10000, partial [Bacteroidetes bacterium]|nr:hypothetical protein [Bacteroidota bacterium]
SVDEVNLKIGQNAAPGLPAFRVVFHSEPSAIVVPVNVVQDVNGQKIVYIAEKEGDRMLARKKVVTVEGVYDNLAQVDGLKAGDLLVTVGYQGLNDGELIKN